MAREVRCQACGEAAVVRMPRVARRFICRACRAHWRAVERTASGKGMRVVIAMLLVAFNAAAITATQHGAREHPLAWTAGASVAWLIWIWLTDARSCYAYYARQRPDVPQARLRE